MGFGFWILGLDFGFWILAGFPKAKGKKTFWVLDFGFWVLDFGFWVLDFGFWILGFGFWVSAIPVRTSKGPALPVRTVPPCKGLPVRAQPSRKLSCN